MTSISPLWGFLFVLLVTGNLSCSTERASDPCCSFTAIPAGYQVDEGQGLLLVQGSTPASFSAENEAGGKAQSQSLNKPMQLPSGRYAVRVNNTVHTVEIREGELAICLTGTLTIAGNTTDYYEVMDSVKTLGQQVLGTSMSYFPGGYTVRVNDTEVGADVRAREVTEIRTGSVLVSGATSEFYYVLDNENKQLNYSTIGQPLAFIPGSYDVKVNNTSMKIDVVAGKVAELITGNLRVNGLTDEYYYVTDSLGKALNYQKLNRQLAFFPGDYQIRVNNTIIKAQVTGGATTEYSTGSLVLTGAGTGYYYVLDDLGNQLNYNTLNRSLSFFPAEYTVRLGTSTHKATVVPGKQTSIRVF